MTISAVSSTTSSSSTSTSTSSTSKSASNAANIVKTLGAGSGIDINALAQGLVEAETGPQRDSLNSKLTKTQSRLTGYDALKYALTDLQTAFATLKDASDFNSLNVSNSQATAFNVSTTSAAVAGTYSVAVSRVATAQRSIASFAASDTLLNGNADFSLNLSVGSGPARTASVNVTTHTPAGIVSAINSSSDFKTLGVSAQLISTGSNVKVVVTGATGLANSFSLTSNASAASGVAFNNPPDPLAGEQAAADALLTVNGVQVSRSSNSVGDVIQGVTLDLNSITSGSATIVLKRDTSAVSKKITDLVSAYNGYVDSINVLNDPKSQVEQFGGALAGDSLLRSIRAQIQDLLIANSSSPGSSIKALRDMGIMFNRYGKLEVSQSQLDSALINHFDEVVGVLSAGAENQSSYATLPGGVAGDVYKKIDAFLRSTGQLASQTQSEKSKVAGYEKELTNLQNQMQRLLDRYLNQFNAMDSIVSSNNSLRTGLTSTFANMAAAYKNQ